MINRKPLKALSFLLVPTSLLLISSPAWCHGPGGAKQPTPNVVSARVHSEHDEHQAFVKQLGLSPEQSQKVEALMQDGHQQSQALKDQLRAKRHTLMEYVQTPDANQGQAMTMNAELNALQRQMSELRLKTFFAMRAQLTPAQLQKLQQLKKREGSEEGYRNCGHSGDSGRPKEHAQPDGKSSKSPAHSSL